MAALGQQLVRGLEVDRLPVDLAIANDQAEKHLLAIDVNTDTKLLQSGIGLVSLLLSARAVEQIKLERFDNCFDRFKG